MTSRIKELCVARRLITFAAFLSLALPCHAGQNVVVVLDDSGSMKDRMRSAQGRVRKITAAKQALLTVLEQLPADANVGVALLNGKVNNSPWLIPLGPVDMNATKKVMDSVRANGGTPLGRFLKTGSDALLAARERESYGSYRLLVVTDGEAGDNNLIERYLPEIKSRGITVDVIGVAMNADHSLATKVHSYRRADNPESLTTAIREVFAETSSATDAGESDFELLDGLPMECASAALTALSTIENAPIGDLPFEGSGNDQSFLNKNMPGGSKNNNRSKNRKNGNGGQSGNGGGGRSGVGKFIGIFIILMVLSGLFSGSKKKRRR